MYKYNVVVNEREGKIISSMSDITQELANMEVSDADHISFKPAPMFSDIEEFGILKTSRTKGIFKKRLVQDYYLELNFKYPDGKSGLCGHITLDFDEIKGMLSNLITHQQLPDISTWIMTTFDVNGKVLPFKEANPHLYQ